MLSIHELISTKMLPPQENVKTICRKRLFEDIGSNHKLIAISAPTGYGKSVFLSQFTANMPCAVAWYQLDDYDNDLMLFVQYLMQAIAKSLPEFGAHTWNYIEKQGDISKNIRSLAAFLVNELQARATHGLICVLDDYHLIHEPSIHALMEELIQYLPGGIQFVIASRHALPFHMTRLRLHNLIFEITEAHLRFNQAEIKSFLQLHQHPPISDELANHYLLETDGWAAALTFMQFPHLEQLSSPHRKNRELMYHYFAEELFQQLPAPVQRFLTETAVLERLEPEICNALVEQTDSLSILEDLLRQNIFIVKNEAGTYRYHHLFRDFLLQQLGERKTLLLQRAAAYFSAHGYYMQAVEAYLRIGNYVYAVQNIEKSALEMIKSCQWSTFQRWLHQIPAHVQEDTPCLLLLQGIVNNYNGLWQLAVERIEKAERHFLQRQDTQYLLEARFQKAITLRRAGQLQNSIAILDTAIDAARQLPLIKWYDIILEKMNTLMWIGALQKVIDALQEGLQLAKQQNEPQLTAYFMEHLGAVHYATGDYYRAVDYYQRAEACYLPDAGTFSKFEMERYSQKTTLAKIYRDWGELDTALGLITDVITAKETYGFIDDLPRAYHEMALISQDMRKTEQAEHYFEKASQLYQRIDRKDFQWAWHLALYGKILVDNGKCAQGEPMIAQAIACAKGNSEFNLAICEFVGCYTLLKTRKIEEAIAMVEHALMVARRVGAKNLIAQCCWALSNIYLGIGRLEQAQCCAKECLRLAATENYLQIFLSYPKTTLPFLRLGFVLGAETAFVDKIVLRLGALTVPMLSDLAAADDKQVRLRAAALLSQVQPPAEPLRNQLYIHAFGTCEMFVADTHQPLVWKTTKTAEIFLYFLKQPQTFLSKDTILEDLWPEMDPEKTSKRLHTYVYQIRKTLKDIGLDENLIYKNKGYSIHRTNIRCDTIEFTQLLQSASQSPTEDAKIAQLEQAVQLYKGDYLQGAYSQWVLEERNRLELLLMQARKELAALYLTQQNYPAAEKHLLAILDIDPLYKEVHDTLLEVYHRSGNAMAAAAQRQKYQDTLDTSFEAIDG